MRTFMHTAARPGLNALVGSLFGGSIALILARLEDSHHDLLHVLSEVMKAQVGRGEAFARATYVP